MYYREFEKTPDPIYEYLKPLRKILTLKKNLAIIFREIENQVFWFFCVGTVFSDVTKLQDKGLSSIQVFSEQKIMLNWKNYMHLRAGMWQIGWPLDKLAPRVVRYKKKNLIERIWLKVCLTCCLLQNLDFDRTNFFFIERISN